MEKASIDGIELKYEIRGAGEPVVLVHWGICAAWAEPLLEAPALSEEYRLLSYHRAGFGGSGRPRGALSMADVAAHCRRLMREVGIERGHIVGHPSSAAIALQLALDAPEAVPDARPDGRCTARARDGDAGRLREGLRRARGRALPGRRQGRRRRHVPERRLRRRLPGPLERGLPGAFERAVAEADTFFGQELPALQAWSFTERDARRVEQPVLAVLGQRSPPTFAERRELLLAWLPDVEPFELPDARHLLHVENPNGMAQALANFFARHPLGSHGSPSAT